jgi:hypothetical protein
MTNTDVASGTGSLKCSWCHDVHGIMNKPRQISSQTYTGNEPNVTVTWNNDAKVYLRGTWYSSPYNEDGAPGAGSGGATGGFTYPANDDGYIDGTDNSKTSGSWGGDIEWADDPTPSGTTGNPPHLVGPNHMVRIQSLNTVTDRGTDETDWPAHKWGAHLDDNVYGTSGYLGHNPYRNNDAPSTSVSLNTPNHYDYSQVGAENAQLCMMCHGALSNLKSLWSGHNVVRGGTTDHTADIFTPRMAISQHYMYNQVEDSFAGNGIDTGYAGELTDDGKMWGTGSYYNWAIDLPGQVQNGITVDTETVARQVGGGGGGTVNAGTNPKQKYHQFTCSKCHTPHASANGRLMITNCMNRDGISAATFNERDGGPGRIVGTQTANDRRNLLATLPEPQNATGLDIADPWVNNFGGHERAVHCHNNIEQGDSGQAENSDDKYWQSIP